MTLFIIHFILFEGDFTVGPLRFVPKTNDLFRLNLHISLWVMLCPQSITVERAKAHTLTGLSSRPHVAVTCALVLLCIVGQRHDSDSNNGKMSGGLTRRGEEEVKYLTDIWADVRRHKQNRDVYKIRRNEGKKDFGNTLSDSTAQRHHYIKVQDRFVDTDGVPVARQNTSGLFVQACWVGCVVTANRPLQGWNRNEPRSTPLGELGSVILFHIRV